MKSNLSYVSPEMAAVWLEKNTDNRRVRLSWVRQLAATMKRGEFKLTHQGIAFSKGGKLLDGQHRLMAIVESDTTQPLLVNTDVEEETFSALDIGVKRSFSDMYRTDPWSSAVSSFLAQVYYNKPTPEQQAKVHEVIGPIFDELRQFCPTTKKGLTNSTVQAAACIRMLAGEDANYIKLVYWNIAHTAHSELPIIGRVFVDQMYARMNRLRHSEKADLFARALKVFDERLKDTARITINSTGPALDFMRQTLDPYLEEKKPAKAQAPTRAKSIKVSHIKAA